MTDQDLIDGNGNVLVKKRDKPKTSLEEEFRDWYYDVDSECDPVKFELLLHKLKILERKNLKC